jgi:hypothetical protein
MSEKMVSILSKGLMYAVGALGILFVLLAFGNWDSITMNRADIDGYVGAAMYVCYIAFIVAALIGIGFGVFHFVTNLKNSKGALVGILVFAVVLVLSYVLASDEVLRSYALGDGSPPSPELVKISGAGIIAFYIFGLLAIAAAIFAEVSRLFK